EGFSREYLGKQYPYKCTIPTGYSRWNALRASGLPGTGHAPTLTNGTQTCTVWSCRTSGRKPLSTCAWILTSWNGSSSKEHGVYLRYTVADLARDPATHERLGL